MKTRFLALAAIASAITLLSGAAQAEQPLELGGYFRSGAGSSSEGGGQVCFRLPGALVWFRLGNECDTYQSLTLKGSLGEVDGTKFKSFFTTAQGTQQVANWEQSSPALREAYVEAQNIGAGLNMPSLNGATLWMGKRFYKNPDVHMLDYAYWEPGFGPGFGLDNVNVGAGKLSYAMFRIGDFTGYGINQSLGGYSPDLIGGGSRTATVHDLRLQDIEVNAGGKLTVGFDLINANNRGTTSTYTTQTTVPVVGVDGKTYNALVQETKTVDNTAGRNGLGVTLSHSQDNPFGLGGFNGLTLQYAKDALLKGASWGGSTDKRTEWLLFDQWVIEPKGSHFTMSSTVGFHTADVNNQKSKEFWIGARPQYHLNNIMSLMSEVGYQSVQPDGGAKRELSKVTLGTQFSMGSSIWARPALRFFSTYAKWNDAAAAAGSVACSGRDCGMAVPDLSSKRSGLSYGVQVEAWF